MRKPLYVLAVILLFGAVAGFADEVTCESKDNRRKECAMDTRGRVWIIRQLSDSACVEGRSWGVSGNSVWVDDGCRAVFASDRDNTRGYRNQSSGGPTQVTCESKDNRRAECTMDTRGRVRIIRQLSDSPCVEGRSWGTYRNSVWVNDGCRAVFASEGGSSGGNWNQTGREPTQVTCESKDNRRAECTMDTRGRVRIIRQLSDSACVEGRSWGTYRNFVWVDNGCRAVFASEDDNSRGYRNQTGRGPTQVTCESKGNRRAECTMDTRGRVRIIRQLSGSQCVEGRNWGVTGNSVWVSGGCRAVFSSEDNSFPKRR
jgi:DNA-binding transcriptional regulator/RsmH inhibitor MraZ